uniref:E3 ISG15--protein ligase HERC5-like isoform X2 n=1 Tax=Oncorhynchus gorbuscha TaxID=8017 RepID=UPI001EAEB628|nr:E3 ISG15--protein ligase HERC5-like isoform X2 [Oncorhynchus gorbuscha]
MFSWGENTRDGFGLVKSKDLVKANTDGCVNFIHLKSPVTRLSAGNKVVAFIRNNGKQVSLARMQDDKDGRRITGKLKGVECREKILALSCCDAHIILLSEEGRVFCLTQSSNVPSPVGNLNHVIQVACGDQHSIALTQDRPAPAPVDCLHLKKTITVSCGGEHTAVLTKGGLVFTFGSGRYGQLGHNSLRNELRPRLVAEFWGAKVTQIACGRNHTLAFVGSFKNIYSFGHGEQGQLGNGVKMDQSVPLPVHLPQGIRKRVE